MPNAADDAFTLAGAEPGRPLFARAVDGTWRTVSAGQFAAEVVALAKGLAAIALVVSAKHSLP